MTLTVLEAMMVLKNSNPPDEFSYVWASLVNGATFVRLFEPTSEAVQWFRSHSFTVTETDRKGIVKVSWTLPKSL